MPWDFLCFIPLCQRFRSILRKTDRKSCYEATIKAKIALSKGFSGTKMSDRQSDVETKQDVHNQLYFQISSRIWSYWRMGCSYFERKKVQIKTSPMQIQNLQEDDCTKQNQQLQQWIQRNHRGTLGRSWEGISRLIDGQSTGIQPPNTIHPTAFTTYNSTP